MAKNKSLLVFVLVLATGIWNPASGHCSSGASFLKMGVGARALGLASAFTAVSDDVTALYWNPAGLAQLEKKEIGGMHALLFGGQSEVGSDMAFDFIGYAHPVKRDSRSEKTTEKNNKENLSGIQDRATGIWVFGVGAMYLNQGKQEAYNQDREQTGEFIANDLAVTMGAARTLKNGVNLGINAKIIRSKIASYSSTGFALDLGHIWKVPGTKFQTGMAIQNIGPQMSYLSESFNLPLTMALGGSYRLFSWVTLASDLRYYPHESRTTFSFGSEFSPVSLLSVRAGYLTNAVRSSQQGSNVTDRASNLSGLGFGLGFKLGTAMLDYSFTPSGELGNTQRISVSLRF